MAEEIWTPEKKRWKHLELEFIHQEQTPKEGITHLDEIRIRFIVCLSFIKLNWWQAMEFHTTYSSWKGLRSDISQTWEGLQEPPVGLKEGMDWYDNKGKRIWMNHRKNSKMTHERDLIIGKN